MQQETSQNIALLCNAFAGSGKSVAVANIITNELSQLGVPHNLFMEQWPDDLGGFTDVFIVGGDGTLNYFLNRYTDNKLPLVIFKGGTGNDFHWLLYGNITLGAQIKLVLDGKPKPVDMGKCNNRHFINAVGIGFEGAVARALSSRKKLPGKTSYLLTILQKIFTYRSKYFRIASNGQHISGRKLLVDISNGRRSGGGFHIAPAASADDGLLDVVIAEALHPIMRLRYLPVIEKGKHLALPIIRHFTTREISVESNDLLQYHLDGEYFEATHLHIELLVAALLFKY